MKYIKKTLLLLGGCAVVLALVGIGCERLPISESSTDTVELTATHIVMREVNPDDLTPDSTGDAFNVYLTDKAVRAEISETIQVDGLPPDATTLYFFSDLVAQQEYMFTYPNEISEADRAAMPEDHPLRENENIIMALSMAERPSGPSDKSLIELMLQPILTYPKDQLQSNASEEYIITDTYVDDLYVTNGEPVIERRTTIDPKTNLPTQVELVDISSGKPIETFAIDQYDIEEESVYASDFFSLDGWKKSLPGEDHVIVEEDITQ